ncbi:MAG: Methionyl-tRNA synthetase [candidate division TM6 bacterium GW2011_GWE2_42_60]|nr:MAG: Methionyl-tRNA synthetase [candidate division TM6 bacterium GW2011_GWE2_42_60]HBY05668.1 methionine--tRNA ligase [Candidatus Dependentiae bacterium]
MANNKTTALCSFYVTTPIYYVNAKPHLGSLYPTLLADVAARWNRLKGCDTFMLTGTDEHGQKVAEAAEKMGMQPQAFVDSLVPAFKEPWKQYNIAYNHFIRTTDQYHVKAVQDWIVQLQKQGDIYKATYEGWYDLSQEAFLTEKDLEFREPGEPPVSLMSGNKARWVSEECYFFKLSAYQDRLLKFYKENPDFITPPERLNEVISFVENGLKDLSISRKTITWGIPFPGDPSHVTYVWADALNNYLTAIGFGDKNRTEEFNTWWPADLQVLGKDIVRFHAVYWPAFLMATGLPLPRKLLVHGWIRINGEKMSKSLGNVVDPVELGKQYGIDPIRYYLMRYVAISQDSSFNTEDLENRINTDLANDFGNLVNRMLTLALKNNLAHVPAPWHRHDADVQLQNAMHKMLEDFEREMSRYYYHQAYAVLWRFVASVNRYFHDQEPWKLVKTDTERFAEVISTTCHAIKAIGLLLWPVMPATIEKLFKALGVEFTEGTNYITLLHEGKFNTDFTLSPLEPLFTKYEEKKPDMTTTPEIPVQNYLAIEDFIKTELAVGTITAVEDVAKSDKIYKLTVDCGTYGLRTICAGVKKFYTPEELMGIKTVFVLNLKPRELFGITSQGMMLMATNSDGKPTIVRADESVPAGTKLK